MQKRERTPFLVVILYRQEAKEGGCVSDGD